MALMNNEMPFNIRFFIGSIEDGNGIEISATVVDYILQKAGFRCFGCESLFRSTELFINRVIGKDLRRVTARSKENAIWGCICPENAILLGLQERRSDFNNSKKTILSEDLLRYDVENGILQNQLFTTEAVLDYFNIESIPQSERLRLLKILKRVIENYDAVYEYSSD